MNKQKKILEALETIKEVCHEMQFEERVCEVCPFYSVSDDGCFFAVANDSPCDWELNTPDRPWHAVF